MAARESYYVVAYDITSDRRRAKVAKMLEDYGRRVNFSVFECSINRTRFVELQQKLARLINIRKDSVLFYSLCRSCLGKVEYLGRSTGKGPSAFISV